MKKFVFIFFCFLTYIFLQAGEKPDCKTAPIPIPGTCPESDYARWVVNRLIEIKGDFGNCFTPYEKKCLKTNIKAIQSQKLTEQQAKLLVYQVRVESTRRYHQQKTEQMGRRECEQKKVSRVRRAQSV